MCESRNQTISKKGIIMIKNVNEIKILRINLSDKKITVEKMDERLVDLFLGGRGINRWILLNEIDKGAKAFDLQNKIIIGTGLLVGSSTLVRVGCK